MLTSINIIRPVYQEWQMEFLNKLTLNCVIFTCRGKMSYCLTCAGSFQMDTKQSVLYARVSCMAALRINEAAHIHISSSSSLKYLPLPLLSLSISFDDVCLPFFLVYLRLLKLYIYIQYIFQGCRKYFTNGVT